MKRTIFLYLFTTIPAAVLSQQKSSAAAGITVSLPWVNNYRYYNYDLKKASVKSGFAGLGGALFYASGKNKYSLNVGFTSDLPAPIGAFDYGHQGTRTNIGSTFTELLYHRTVSRFSIIGGVQYTRYRFYFTSYVNNLPSYTGAYKTLGVTAGGSYRLGKSFSLALFYRPAFVSSGVKQYSHLIALDARFDIQLWRRN